MFLRHRGRQRAVGRHCRECVGVSTHHCCLGVGNHVAAVHRDGRHIVARGRSHREGRGCAVVHRNHAVRRNGTVVRVGHCNRVALHLEGGENLVVGCHCGEGVCTVGQCHHLAVNADLIDFVTSVSGYREGRCCAVGHCLDTARGDRTVGAGSCRDGELLCAERCGDGMVGGHVLEGVGGNCAHGHVVNRHVGNLVARGRCDGVNHRAARHHYVRSVWIDAAAVAGRSGNRVGVLGECGADRVVGRKGGERVGAVRQCHFLTVNIHMLDGIACIRRDREGRSHAIFVVLCSVRIDRAVGAAGCRHRVDVRLEVSHVAVVVQHRCYHIRERCFRICNHQVLVVAQDLADVVTLGRRCREGVAALRIVNHMQARSHTAVAMGCGRDVVLVQREGGCDVLRCRDVLCQPRRDLAVNRAVHRHVHDVVARCGRELAHEV